MSDQNQPVAAPQYTAAQLIDLFIQLRDKKGAMAEKHRAEMETITAPMAMVEGMLMDMCNKAGTDGLKAKGIGSASIITKKSASIDDPESFRQFIIDNEQWDMVSWSAKVEPVETYTNANAALPPGVKISAYNTMSVRRATKKAGE